MGFWRLFRKVFIGYATPVLDFYHALKGKAIKPWLDHQGKTARDYASETRKLFKAGPPDLVLDDINNALLFDDIPPSVRKKLENLYIAYTLKNILTMLVLKYLDHQFGGGMVESACKWLIQQRFKGVGMRV